MQDKQRPRPSARQIALICVLAALAATAVAAAFHFDWPVREAIVESQGKRWNRTPEYARIAAVSKYGDWPQLMVAGLAGALVAWRMKSKTWVRIFVAAMVASTAAGILANASRLTTGRPRPREVPKIADGWYGPYHDGRILVGDSKFNAFPSGHTATAVGFAAVFLFAGRWVVGAMVMAGALGIAWSRMALGAHHLSDVTVSIILATGVAYFVWRVAVRRGDALAAGLAGRIARWRRP